MQQPPVSPDGRYWWNGTQWVPMRTPISAQPSYANPASVDPVLASAGAANAATGRWSRGWRISKLSIQVVMSDKQLLLLPILSAFSLVVMLALFVGPAVAFQIWEPQDRIASYVWLFCLYLSSSFITYFFAAAMVATAALRLEGRAASAGDGLAMAWGRKGKILKWALLSVTVGMVIRAIQQRLGLFGRLLGLFGGLAWALTTWFIVPVLVFEDLSVWGSFKRSGSVVKQRWGEGLAAGGSATLIVFLAALFGTLVGAFLMVLIAVPVGVAFIIVSVAFAMILGSALNAVYKTAVYEFAVNGHVGAGFSSEDLSAAFRSKRRRLGL